MFAQLNNNVLLIHEHFKHFFLFQLEQKLKEMNQWDGNYFINYFVYLYRSYATLDLVQKQFGNIALLTSRCCRRLPNKKNQTGCDSQEYRYVRKYMSEI